MAARKGEAHHKAKLTDDQVREMRAQYAAGKTSQFKLALEYGGLDIKTVWCIVHRRTWRHV